MTLTHVDIAQESILCRNGRDRCRPSQAGYVVWRLVSGQDLSPVEGRVLSTASKTRYLPTLQRRCASHITCTRSRPTTSGPPLARHSWLELGENLSETLGLQPSSRITFKFDCSDPSLAAMQAVARVTKFGDATATCTICNTWLAVRRPAGGPAGRP